jgi:hypothetical protein
MVTMRCDEVIRELAAPTDDRDGTALADHLAGCPSCSDWARQAARLDQLWDATRPPEPSPEAWGTVWANIAQSLPSAAAHRESTSRPSRNGTATKVLTYPAPTHVANPPRIWRMGAAALMGLAQAAAILVAIGLAWRGQPSAPKPENVRVAQDQTPSPPRAPSAIRVDSPVRVEADIEEGRLLVILADGPLPQVMDKTPAEMAYRVDSMLLMFNEIESMGHPMIASR